MSTFPSSKIREQLFGFLSETFPQFDPALPDTTPIAEYGFDSLGVTEIMLYLEDHFKIQIEDSELTQTNFGTIHGLVSFVTQKLRSKSVMTSPRSKLRGRSLRQWVKQWVSPFPRRRLGHPTKKQPGTKRPVALGR
jgi:acyl carrier protein